MVDLEELRAIADLLAAAGADIKANCVRAAADEIERQHRCPACEGKGSRFYVPRGLDLCHVCGGKGQIWYTRTAGP